jgi:hypothetical protein
MKFLMIHCINEAVMQVSPDRMDEEDPAETEELDAWVAEMEANGVKLYGSRLRMVRDARTVRMRAGEVLVSDGPFAETKEQIVGFDVIECASMDVAIEIAARHPTARFGTIEVRPFLP